MSWFHSVLIGLLLSSPTFASNWILASDMGGVKVWQHQSSADVTGSFQRIEKKSNFDLLKDPERYFKAFSAKKIRMLSLIGISEWKAHSYKWTAHPEHQKLEVVGSYQDSQKQLIRFKEVHLIRKNFVDQFLQTYPETQKGGEVLAQDFFQLMQDKMQ